MKYVNYFFFSFMLIICLFCCDAVNASDTITAKGMFSIFTISGEQLVRETNSVQYSQSSLKSDQYLSFSFIVKNNGSAPYNIKKLCARINGGECLEWAASPLPANTSTNCHIFYVHMKKYKAGTYDVAFYVNDQLIESQTFTILNTWNDKISLPNAADLSSFRTSERAPYVALYPDFPKEGFTEYAVDFRADHQPYGTYLSILDWHLTPGSLNRKYKSIEEETNAYAGFQIDFEGNHLAIMSVWDTFARDSNGARGKIRANRIYPDKCRDDGTFDGEGTGVHCVVPFNWKANHSYRALLQQGKAPNGNTTIVFWVCDLQTKVWTRLVEYDINRTDTHMVGIGPFLENFMPKTAGEIRTMVLSNMRVRSASSGRWVGIKGGSFYQNFDWPGSYSYGSEGAAFWTVTTGLPNRCRVPSGHYYSVQYASTVDPY